VRSAQCHTATEEELPSLKIAERLEEHRGAANVLLVEGGICFRCIHFQNDISEKRKRGSTMKGRKPVEKKLRSRARSFGQDECGEKIKNGAATS